MPKLTNCAFEGTFGSGGAMHNCTFLGSSANGWRGATDLPAYDFEGDDRILDGDDDEVAIVDVGRGRGRHLWSPLPDLAASGGQDVRVGTTLPSPVWPMPPADG